MRVPLECEMPGRRHFKTQTEARLAVSDFFEDWRNPRRRPSKRARSMGEERQFLLTLYPGWKRRRLSGSNIFG
jgi:hypothetical protein